MRVLINNFNFVSITFKKQAKNVTLLQQSQTTQKNKLKIIQFKLVATHRELRDTRVQLKKYQKIVENLARERKNTTRVRDLRNKYREKANTLIEKIRIFRMNKTILKKKIQNLKKRFFKRNFNELENFDQKYLRSSHKHAIVIEIFKLLQREKSRINLDRNNLNEFYAREQKFYNSMIYERSRDIKYLDIKKIYNDHEK